MNQENQDKLFKAIGDIKDVLVNIVAERAISLADRAASENKYNEDKRKQAKEFSEELKARMEGYNSTGKDNFGEPNCDKMVGSLISEHTKDNRTEKQRTTYPQKPKTVQHYWSYEKYLNQLKQDFKDGIATRAEIREFILRYKLGGYFHISIEDVQKDLKNNGIKIVESQEQKERLIKAQELKETREGMVKKREIKTELLARPEVEPYLQVEPMESMDDDFFCT